MPSGTASAKKVKKLQETSTDSSSVKSNAEHNTRAPIVKPVSPSSASAMAPHEKVLVDISKKDSTLDTRISKSKLDEKFADRAVKPLGGRTSQVEITIVDTEDDLPNVVSPKSIRDLNYDGPTYHTKTTRPTIGLKAQMAAGLQKITIERINQLRNSKVLSRSTQVNIFPLLSSKTTLEVEPQAIDSKVSELITRIETTKKPSKSFVEEKKRMLSRVSLVAPAGGDTRRDRASLRKSGYKKRSLSIALSLSHTFDADQNINFPNRGEGDKRKKSLKDQVRVLRALWHNVKVWWKKKDVKQSKFSFFEKEIRTVESRFGSGMGSFFSFVNWLYTLNALFAIVWTLFIAFPQAVDFDQSTVDKSFHVRQLLLGGGAFEQSWMFYGAYNGKLSTGYPLAIMYLCCVFFTYFGGFIIILKSISVALTEEYLGDTRYTFSVIGLTTWDHSMKEGSAYKSRCTSIINAYHDVIQEIQTHRQLAEQSSAEQLQLFFRRLIAWTMTLLCISLGIALIFIAVTTDYVAFFKGYGLNFSRDHIMVTYTPTAVFVVVNAVIPVGIYFLPSFERYAKGKTEVYVTTSRVFILRTLNMIALVVSLRRRVVDGYLEGCAGAVIGQELYKLIISDSVVGIASSVLPNTMEYFYTNEPVELHIPSQMLLIMYRISLIWLGVIVCPVLPLIGVVSLTVFFLSCYYLIIFTGRPPSKRYKMPRRSTFFMSLTACNVLILIVIVSIIICSDYIFVLGHVRRKPSELSSAAAVLTDEVCGPYNMQEYTSVFNAWRSNLSQFGEVVSVIFEFMISRTVVVPVLFFLFAMIHYQQLKIYSQWELRSEIETELKQERISNRLLLKEVKLVSENAD